MFFLTIPFYYYYLYVQGCGLSWEKEKILVSRDIIRKWIRDSASQLSRKSSYRRLSFQFELNFFSLSKEGTSNLTLHKLQKLTKSGELEPNYWRRYTKLWLDTRLLFSWNEYFGNANQKVLQLNYFNLRNLELMIHIIKLITPNTRVNDWKIHIESNLRDTFLCMKYWNLLYLASI